VKKLRSLLPKDNEEAAGKVKHLYALLEPATLMDHVFVNESKKRGQGTTVISAITLKVCEKMQSAAHLPLGSGATRI
jgi:hypothetical protein